MNTDPVIEVTALDVLAYKKDRSTVIGRPRLVLMFDPICGCVLNHTIEVHGSPSDASAQTQSSWPPQSGAPTFVIDAGSDFRSLTQIYSSFKLRSCVERAFMQITEHMRRKHGVNRDSTRLTLAEIQQRVRVKIDIHNETIRKVQNNRRPDKIAGTGIPLSMRRAYYSVLQSSLECGFDVEQVNSIWQTASYAYPVGQLRMMLEEIVKDFHSTKMYHDYYHSDLTHLQSLFKPPVNIPEGEGAKAFRVLADVKDQYDKKAFIWTGDFDWTESIGSWADLTYVLLKKLVNDGLATDNQRCKLFARDLGL